MKKIIFIIFCLTLSVAAFAQNTLQPLKPVKVWECAKGLKVPESVLFDAVSGIIYVSNIDGKPSEKDGKGFISTISQTGELIKAEWVKGLDAPKGMAIYRKHLFVTNIDEVVEIDIATAKIVNHYKAEGAQFLNDIAVDNLGVLYISDSQAGCVYRLKEGKILLWQKGELFKGSNGLCFGGGLLYVGTANSILKVNILSGKTQKSVENTCGVDGLYLSTSGKLVFTDWSGMLYTSAQGKKPELLLNTSIQKVNSADFGVIPPKNMILIPTFFDNKVVCYTTPAIN